MITVKNKFEVVFKKLQSYSFIIFIGLIVIAFVVIAAINQTRNNAGDPQDTADNTDVVAPGDNVNDLLEEEFKLPTSNETVRIVREYYDLAVEDKAILDNAVVEIADGVYREHNGLNYALENKEVFDVTASLSGEVIKVEESETYGKWIEVEHELGFVTRYYALSEASVEVGDLVEQGDVLGKAGQNFDTASGNHVHFEILLNGKTLNPHNMIGKQLKDFKQE